MAPKLEQTKRSVQSKAFSCSELKEGHEALIKVKREAISPEELQKQIQDPGNDIQILLNQYGMNTDAGLGFLIFMSVLIKIWDMSKRKAGYVLFSAFGFDSGLSTAPTGLWIGIGPIEAWS